MYLAGSPIQFHPILIPYNFLGPWAFTLRTGGRSLKDSAQYPRDFGREIARLHVESMVPWLSLGGWLVRPFLKLVEIESLWHLDKHIYVLVVFRHIGIEFWTSGSIRSNISLPIQTTWETQILPRLMEHLFWTWRRWLLVASRIWPAKGGCSILVLISRNVGSLVLAGFVSFMHMHI